MATFTTNTVTLGTQAMTAVYSGDGNFTSSTSTTLTQTVTQAGTTTTVTASTNSSLCGQMIYFSATLTALALSTGTPTGTVTFEDDGTSIGTDTLTPTPLPGGEGQEGLATFCTSTLATGTDTITAVYGGDTNFTGSSSGSLVQTVNCSPNVGTINTIAGTGAAGYSGDGGAATAANLDLPSGVALDGQGNVYIADTGNNVIREVSPSGVITTLVGNGTAGFSGDRGPATAAELNQPEDVAVDAAGDLFIADTFNNCIREVFGPTPPPGYFTGEIITVAGNGTGGYSGDGGAATTAELNGPSGVAVDALGNVYIADSGNNRIREVSSGVITTVAGDGTYGLGDGGPATAAEIDDPQDVAVDALGNVYIADSGNNRIREVSSGVITTVAGNGTAGYSGDGGAATAAELNYPSNVTVDGAGNIYIADSSNDSIREVSSGVIITIAGTGTAGYSGDDGPATAARLNHPVHCGGGQPGSFTFDGILIVDTWNNVIRKLTITPCHTALSVGLFNTGVDSSGNVLPDETAPDPHYSYEYTGATPSGSPFSPTLNDLTEAIRSLNVDPHPSLDR